MIRYLCKAVKYLYAAIVLTRVLSIIAAFALVLLGVVLAGLSNILGWIFAFLSIACTAGAIYTYNTVAERELDVKGGIFRYERAGVTEKEARIIAVAYIIGSIIFGFLAGILVLVVSLFILVLGLAYSWPKLYLKRVLVINNAILAIGYSLPILAGYISQRNTPGALLVVAAFFMYAFFASISKDFRDYDADKAFGIKTFPIVLGKKLAAVLMYIGLIITSYVFYVCETANNLAAGTLIAVLNLIIGTIFFVILIASKKRSKQAFVLYATWGMVPLYALLLTVFNYYGLTTKDIIEAIFHIR